MMDVMPSRGLVIHEYRKHGVCSGLDPDAYYALARRLFQKVRIPSRFMDPANNQMVDTRAVIGEFVAANPGLTPQMLAVSCAGTGDRLREVRICFSREGQFRDCGNNEDQRRLCGAPRVFVPPVRQGRGADPLERRR
jgi:ribonuclease T2